MNWGADRQQSRTRRLIIATFGILVALLAYGYHQAQSAPGAARRARLASALNELAAGGSRTDTANVLRLVSGEGTDSIAPSLQSAAVRIILDQTDSTMRRNPAAALFLLDSIESRVTFDQKQRFDAARERATEAATKRLKDLAIKGRAEYAQRLEQQYLRQGMDVTVSTRGSDAGTIRITWILVSRPLAFQLSESPQFLPSLREQGFRRVEISNGYGEEWYWDLE